MPARLAQSRVREAQNTRYLQANLGFSRRFRRIFTASVLVASRAATTCALGAAALSPVYLYMPIAFKEWAVTVRALAEGEQLLTLRKGGIREPEQALQARARPLLPLPDVRPSARRSGARVAPARAAPGTRGGRVERRRAARAGAAPRRATLSSPTASGSAPGPKSPATSRSPTRAASTRCRRSTCGRTDYAEKRLAWKRRHPLHVILLRTYRIPRPVTVKVSDEYGGCRSWLELTRELPFEGTPVLSDDEFERASEEIESIAREGRPAGSGLDTRARHGPLRTACSSAASDSRARQQPRHHLHGVPAERLSSRRADQLALQQHSGAAAGRGTTRPRPGRKSGTSKPRSDAAARHALLEQQPWMNSASAWLRAPTTLTSSPSVYWGLIFRARRCGSLGLLAPAAPALDERDRARAQKRSLGGWDARGADSRTHRPRSSSTRHLERHFPDVSVVDQVGADLRLPRRSSPTMIHSTPGQLAAKLMSVCDG